MGERAVCGLQPGFALDERIRRDRPAYRRREHRGGARAQVVRRHVSRGSGQAAHERHFPRRVPHQPPGKPRPRLFCKNGAERRFFKGCDPRGNRAVRQAGAYVGAVRAGRRAGADRFRREPGVHGGAPAALERGGPVPVHAAHHGAGRGDRAEDRRFEDRDPRGRSVLQRREDQAARREPPRQRPRDRLHDQPRAGEARPHPDETAQHQRRAHEPLPERPVVFAALQRIRLLCDRRGGHREPRRLNADRRARHGRICRRRAEPDFR